MCGIEFVFVDCTLQAIILHWAGGQGVIGMDCVFFLVREPVVQAMGERILLFSFSFQTLTYGINHTDYTFFEGASYENENS